MYEVPASALPETTRVAVSRCSRGMEPRCNPGGFRPSIYCAGTRVLLGASEGSPGLHSTTAGVNAVLCLQPKMQHGSFQCGRMCNKEALCLEKSSFNGVFLLMTVLDLTQEPMENFSVVLLF